jgi:tetratricopeptide (TPR) repeat protein
MKADDYAGARDVVAPLLKDNQTDSTANYITAQAYLREGNYRQAEAYFAQVASASPDSEEAQTDPEAARTLQRGETATIAKVKQLLNSNGTAQAGIRLASYLLQVKPDNLDARIALADYYERGGQLDSAGRVYVGALEHVSSDRAAELAARLESFAAEHSADPSAHDLLARAYAAAGRLPEAEQEFNKALSLSEDDIIFQVGVKQDFADIYTRFGHEALSKGDETAAGEYFDKALQLNRDDTRKTDVVELGTKMGERAIRGGAANAALRAFGKAAANMPSTGGEKWRDRLVKDYGLLANKLTNAGDLKRAVFAHLGAYQLDTEDEPLKRKLANAYDTYGLKLYGEGKYGEALRQFKEAVKLFGDDSTYAGHVSDAQREL